MTIKPTPEQIEATITKLEERLQDKAINRTKNFPVKEGYTKAIEILRSGITDWQKADLEKLKTTQGRAIAYLAISYLNGKNTEEALINVPIKHT